MGLDLFSWCLRRSHRSRFVFFGDDFVRVYFGIDDGRAAIAGCS